jgi:hypothetical protein
MSLEGRADTMVLSTGCYSSAVLPRAAQGTQRNPGGGHPLGVGWHGDTKSPQGALCWQCPPCSRTPRRSWGQALGPRLHLYTPLSSDTVSCQLLESTSSTHSLHVGVISYLGTAVYRRCPGGRCAAQLCHPSVGVLKPELSPGLSSVPMLDLQPPMRSHNCPHQ